MTVQRTELGEEGRRALVKFVVGEPVEVLCDHLEEGRRIHGWLRGQVIQVDRRMAAVRLETDVFSSQGDPVPDRILWCAHGSPNLRRPDDPG